MSHSNKSPILCCQLGITVGVLWNDKRYVIELWDLTGGWQSSENIQRHHEVQHELRFISTQYTHYQSVDDILQLLQDVWSTKYKMLNQVYTMNFFMKDIYRQIRHNRFPLLEIFCIVISGWKNTSALRSIRYRDIIFTKHKNNNNKKDQ